MWIWIVCIVVLIICFFIALRIIMRSSDPFPTETKVSLFRSLSPSDMSYFIKTMHSLQSKIKSLEARIDFYESHSHTQPVQPVPEERPLSFPPAKQKAPEPGYGTALEEEDDWKEMFYEENEKKEKLENELDKAEQKIESLEQEIQNLKAAPPPPAPEESPEKPDESEKLKEEISRLNDRLSEAYSKNLTLESQLKELIDLNHQLSRQAEQSNRPYHHPDQNYGYNPGYYIRPFVTELENRLNEAQSELSELRQHLADSRKYQEELYQQLQNEKKQRAGLEDLVNSARTLQNENDGYRRQIAEMATQQAEIEGKLLYLNELENKITTIEEEKAKMISTLEIILSQSKRNNS